MKCLFIGRFQPFHRGHYKVIRNALKNCDEVIVGIGSSQLHHTKDNPFTADERIQMIEKTFRNEFKKQIRIVLIPDIYDPPNWVEHVLSIVNDFDVVLTNNSFTKILFEEKGFSVKKTPIYDKHRFSGEIIRKKIGKNEKWEDLVPSEVEKIIKESNGVERINKTANK